MYRPLTTFRVLCGTFPTFCLHPHIMSYETGVLCSPHFTDEEIGLKRSTDLPKSKRPIKGRREIQTQACQTQGPGFFSPCPSPATGAGQSGHAPGGPAGPRPRARAGGGGGRGGGGGHGGRAVRTRPQGNSAPPPPPRSLPESQPGPGGSHPPDTALTPHLSLSHCYSPGL